LKKTSNSIIVNMGKKPTNNRKRIGILLTDSQNEGKKEEIISLRRRVPPRP